MGTKIFKNVIFSLLIPVLLAASLVVAPARLVNAEEEKGSITVHFVPGATFRIYKVADYDGTGQMTAEKCTLAENLKQQIENAGGALEGLKPYGTQTTKEASGSEGFEITGHSDVLDKDADGYKGAAMFSGLDRGLYLLTGDAKAAAAFTGYYMTQYSWAEETAAKLYFMIGSNSS